MSEEMSHPSSMLAPITLDQRSLYRTLADAMPQIVWTAGPDGTVDYYNQRWFEYTGLTLEQTEGWEWKQILHPDDLQNTIDRWNQALQTGEQYEIEYRFRRASDGSYRWHLGRSLPIRDAEGNIIQWIGTATDIDDRKRVEENLRHAHAHLSSHVENSPQAVIEWDAEFRVTRWSGMAEQIFGWNADDVMGKHPREWGFVHSEDIRSVGAVLARLIDGVDTRNQFSGRNFRKDGTIIHCEWHNSLLPGQGGLPSILSLVVDVSARTVAEKELQKANEELENRVEKRTAELAESNRQLSQEIRERTITEKRLRESEKRFRNSFDHAPIGISIVSPDGKWVEVNRTLCQMVGYTEQELQSIDFQKITHPDDLGRDIEHIRRMLDGSIREYQLEKRYIHKNGHVIWILLSASLMRDEIGKPLYFIAQIVDITERKRAEQILQQAKETAELGNRAKSDFLAVMSHEIRTPMNAVIGMTGLLLDTTLSTEQREYVETVRICSEALLTIINDTLDFSKIESGMMELEQQPFVLRSCIEEALDLVTVAATSKGVDLSCMIADGTPDMIVGDVTRVRQILVNLAGNAVKFTEYGAVDISVSSTEREDGRHEILFSVRDSGIGIEPAQLDRLFRSFSQVDLSTTRKYGGTGLGLAIAKMLCEAMGGRIWVESNPGSGSTFYFTIIVSSFQKTRRRQEDRTMLQEKRVAIIVEREVVASILHHQCEQWGMIPTVIRGYDGSVSLGENYDLAIIDLRTRERLGMDLRGLIDTVRGESGLPALLLTAMAVHELRQQHIDVESIAFLSKPIKQSQMLDTVATLLGGPDPAFTGEAPSTAETVESRMPADPLRILLAEDNVVNQKVALGIMKGLGYRADIAANGLEVLDALARQPYDLVFMDVQMPEMDGLEASRRIRMEMPEERQPMIIAMTANAIAGYRDECLAAGMNGYITKPIRKSKLVEALQQASACKALMSSVEALPRGVDPVLYRRFGDEIAESAPDALVEILECFLTDAPAQIASLMDALGERDRVLLSRTAHTLKSTSEMLGASRLAALCRSLESDEHGVESDVISFQVARIDSELNEVAGFIRGELASLREVC